MHTCNNCIARNMNAHAQLCEKNAAPNFKAHWEPTLTIPQQLLCGSWGSQMCCRSNMTMAGVLNVLSWGPAAVLCSSPWRFAGGHDTSIPHMEVIYKLLGVQVNVGDRWGGVKHYFIRWTWFTDFSKTKSTLLGTNLQTWSVQVKMLLTNLLTWRVLQTWRVQVNEE